MKKQELAAMRILYISAIVFSVLFACLRSYMVLTGYDAASGFYTSEALHNILRYGLLVFAVLAFAAGHIYIKEENPVSPLPETRFSRRRCLHPRRDDVWFCPIYAGKVPPIQARGHGGFDCLSICAPCGALSMDKPARQTPDGRLPGPAHAVQRAGLPGDRFRPVFQSEAILYQPHGRTCFRRLCLSHANGRGRSQF